MKRKKSVEKTEKSSGSTLLNKNNESLAKESTQEIDDLFEELKARKKEKKIEISKKNRTGTSAKIDNDLTEHPQNSSYAGHMKPPSMIISPEAPLERIDKESGLPVYKAHLLKVGDGGGTPLCPFDCDCCF